jgi:hypothetical protein
MGSQTLHREFQSARATFSNCRKYRYTLSRTWDAGLPTACWLLLNPSTADEQKLDPTLRRCVGFSRAWGFGSMVVANLFAIRSPYPRHVYAAADPVGPQNDAHIRRLTRAAGKVIVGWGVHGAHGGRNEKIVRLLIKWNVEPWCLGLTEQGHPRHPLYVEGSTELIRFEA